MKVLQAELGVLPGEKPKDRVVSSIVEEEEEDDTSDQEEYPDKNRSTGTGSVGGMSMRSKQASLFARRRSSVALLSPYRTIPPVQWKPEHVGEWIFQMGSPYTELKTNFAKVDGPKLLKMSESDLKDLKISNPVHRLELYRRMRNLKTSTVNGTLPSKFNVMHHTALTYDCS